MKHKTLKAINDYDVEYKKGMDIRYMDNAPRVRHIVNMDYFFAHLFDEPTEEKKLARELEYEETFREEHSFDYFNVDIVVDELDTPYEDGRRVWNFINGYYVTPYGRLYSITDMYDDTHGWYDYELTNEVRSLIESCLNDNDLLAG